MDPVAEPIDLPAGYGTATTTMDWAAVQSRLEEAPRYWLVTTRRDGRAHVVPVDGLWLDDAWWPGGSPDTLHQRNLEHDRRVVVRPRGHHGPRVILVGSVERVPPSPELTDRLMAASKAKHGYTPPPNAYAEGAWALRPERARAWSAFHRRHPLPARLTNAQENGGQRRLPSVLDQVVFLEEEPNVDTSSPRPDLPGPRPGCTSAGPSTRGPAHRHRLRGRPLVHPDGRLAGPVPPPGTVTVRQPEVVR